MALTTICDNCTDYWVVDAIIHVESVDKNLCPCCVNQLIDLCLSRMNNAVIRQVATELEDM